MRLVQRSHNKVKVPSEISVSRLACKLALISNRRLRSPCPFYCYWLILEHPIVGINASSHTHDRVSVIRSPIHLVIKGPVRIARNIRVLFLGHRIKGRYHLHGQ